MTEQGLSGRSLEASAGATAVTPREIERRSDLTHEEFVERYRKGNQPVVITDAIRKWKALSAWTLDSLKARFGARKVVSEGKEFGFGQVLDSLTRSSKEQPAVYLTQLSIPEDFPELMEDISPLPIYCLPDWLSSRFLPKIMRTRSHAVPQIFIGGTGTAFPRLHVDSFHLHAFTSQVIGRKKFILYSPTQDSFVYPTGPTRTVSMIKGGAVETPDLQTFPLFAKAIPYTCVLEPGDSIFIPTGWWHTTRILSTSVTVSRNCADSASWGAVVKDVQDRMRAKRPLLAGTVSAYFRGFGWVKSRWGRRS